MVKSPELGRISEAASGNQGRCIAARRSGTAGRLAAGSGIASTRLKKPRE